MRERAEARLAGHGEVDGLVDGEDVGHWLLETAKYVGQVCGGRYTALVGRPGSVLMSGGGWAKPKGGKQGAGKRSRRPVDEQPAIELDSLIKYTRSEFVYDMDQPEARARLLRMMWTGRYEHAAGAQLDGNPGLTWLLAQLTTNSKSDRVASEDHEFKEQFRFEGIMSTVCRQQSQKQMPLWTALGSVDAVRCQCSAELWDWLHLMQPGTLASLTWTEGIIAEAPKYDPGCPYKCIEGVAAAIFDNYSRKCLYKSLATVESAGYRIDMTNWGEFGIPVALKPAGFDAEAACAWAPASHMPYSDVRAEHPSPYHSPLTVVYWSHARHLHIPLPYHESADSI